MSPTIRRRTITAAVIVALSLGAAILTTSGRGDAVPDVVAVNTTTTAKPTTTTTTEAPAPDERGDQVDLDRLTERATAIPAPAPETETEGDEPGGEPSGEPATDGGGGGDPGPAAPSGGGVTPESIAASYGLGVSYGPTPCGQRPRAGHVGGCIDPADPSVIHLTARSPHGRAVLVTRHEVAHVLIIRKCGTWAPPITGGYPSQGGRSEHVTDAYGALFIGPTSTDYGYTPADADIARRIHAGDCGGGGGAARPPAPSAPAPRPAPATTTTTAPPPPPLPVPGRITATVAAKPGRKVDVSSPQPVDSVGACTGTTVTGGWSASCAGGRVAVTTPTAGVEPGDSTTVRVSTAMGWSYTVVVTAT